MSLLDRIAHRNGDPQRAMNALRLINECLAREVQGHPAQSRADLCRKGLSARLRRAERQINHTLGLAGEENSDDQKT